jgi:CO/xanthine dehydrogenase FAD-binding subunit
MTTMRSIANLTYQAPLSLKEALTALKNHGPGCRVLAGGTDLIVQMKQGRTAVTSVVDVKRLPELNRLEWTKADGLNIGAAVSLSRLLEFPALSAQYPLLYQACSLIGSNQIKNRATLGGNLCNAAPSADSAPALLCLGATVVATAGGRIRRVPLAEFFRAPGLTALSRGEILREVAVPTPPPHSAGAYFRHTPREEMDIAVAGVAAFITLTPRSRKVKTARLALSAVAPTPILAPVAEAVLTGEALTAEIIERAAAAAAAVASPISDLRASAEYRRELVRALARKALLRVCAALEIKI